MENENKEKDVVEHPSHYSQGSFETIDEMVLMFGLSDTIAFCKLNAWKYRARAPYKGNPEQDMGKADFYLRMMYELMEKVEADPPLLKGRWHKEGKE